MSSELNLKIFGQAFLKYLYTYHYCSLTKAVPPIICNLHENPIKKCNQEFDGIFEYSVYNNRLD